MSNSVAEMWSDHVDKQSVGTEPRRLQRGLLAYPGASRAALISAHQPPAGMLSSLYTFGAMWLHD